MASVSFAPDATLHSAEEALVHEIAHMFARYIKSHLEVLGLDKMCLALEQKYGEPPLDAIKEAFGLFDIDGDGHITPEELLSMLTTVDNTLEESSVGDLMSKADLDGDGVISFEEFYTLLMGKPPPQVPTQTAQEKSKHRKERAHTLAFGKGRAMADSLGEEAEPGEVPAVSAERQRTPPKPRTPPEENEPGPKNLAGLAMAAAVSDTADLDGGSTTEEEEPSRDAELSLQDRIDDALDAAFVDIDTIRSVLSEAQRASHSHPSVTALEIKLEDLGGPVAPGGSNEIGAEADLAGRLLLGGLRQPIAEPEPEPEEAVVSAPGKFSIKVWEARSIPKMDRFGKTDAFVQVECGGDIRETPVVESQNPYWGMAFDIEVTNAKYAVVTVLDKDAASSEKIGEIRLLLADFAGGKEKEDWHKLMPTPGGLQISRPKKSRRRMSITYVPDTSNGLGDLRLGVAYTPPVVGKTGPAKKKVLHPVGKLGVMHVTVLQARGLPKMDRFSHTDSYAKIQFLDEVGDTFTAMDTEEPKWNQEFQFEVDSRKELTGRLQCSVWDRDDGPDPDDIIGHADLDLHDDLLLGREDNVWLQLRPAEGSPGGKKLGQLNIKVWFEAKRAPEWDDDLDGQYDPIRSAYSYLKMTSPVHRKNEMLKAQPRFVGKVACCVMEGRGLPKMDRFGGTDAYVEVEFAGMIRHTEVAKDGAKPFWNQAFDFDVESRQRGLKFTVYDQEVRGEDEPVGSIVMPVNAATLGMGESQMGEAWAEGQWRELEPVAGGPKLPPGQSLGELFIKVVWVPANAPTGKIAGGAANNITASPKRGEAVVVPRLTKVTPKMGWSKLKTKASEDQHQRAQERGPMDVDQMLSVWKKGAPMKARMGAMFSKAKVFGNMMLRRSSVQPNLSVETEFGAESPSGPNSVPSSGKRLKGIFGRVKVANMLRSPASSEKYAAPDSSSDKGNGTEQSQASTRSLKGVFRSVKNANALSEAAPQQDSQRPVRSAWAENPAPGEMRDDDR